MTVIVRRCLLLIVLLALLAIPVGTAATDPTSPRPGPSPIPGTGAPAPDVADLVTADGAPFQLADLRGSWTYVFFGYTHCPDVCPTTLGELIGVLGERPDARAVFISIDPERDTPAFLASWTAYLPEGLIGVTGSPTAIRAAADRYGVTYARVDTGSAAGYAMSHTATVWLIDPAGIHRLTYPFGTPAAAMIADLGALESVAPSASPLAAVRAEEAWTRSSPMGGGLGAAYLVLHNDGSVEDALVSVTSPAAAVVELHRSSLDADGTVTMTPVDTIPVPAGGSATLEPGGLHLMLIDLVAPLDPGTVVPLMLTFQSGQVLEVVAEVRAAMPMGSPAPAASGSAMPRPATSPPPA